MKVEYHGIELDLSRDALFADYARGMIMDFYAIETEENIQQVFARAAIAWSAFKGKTDYALAQRLYDGVSRKHFMFASPVLSNAPCPATGEKRGLPISCFLTYVPDTIEGLIDHSSELRYLSVFGGGVGGHWSDVRSVSDKAPGPIPFLSTVDADMTAYRQGKTRKGSYAAYIDVTHPDIQEFMNIRIPTGDTNRKCLNLHNAINLTDDFMKAVVDGKTYELIDPAKGPTGEFLSARKVWQQILEVRFRTGEPYLNFIDTANSGLPQTMKDKGLKIHGSNLCNEIHLPTAPDRSAVCCLSSVNLEKYDEWKGTTLVKDIIIMLDNVIEYFIENAPDAISRARYSAEQERSLGLGAMGFHSYLMSKDLAFESEAAASHNHIMFGTIKQQAVAATEQLAKMREEAPDMVGTGRRNAHLLAVAPNASSGLLLSTSPSIEPLKANAYTHRTRAGSFLIKNPHLETLLTKHKRNDEETWQSIIVNKGSVQQLKFLSDKEKNVFKTSFELDQLMVVKHAAHRQQFICQGQSVNLFFLPGVSRDYVNRVHLDAWLRGLKGLYYLRTEAKQRAENVGDKVERLALTDANQTIIYGKPGCPFCEKAKTWFEVRGIEYEYVDIEELGKTAAEVTGRKDVKSVPQVYIEGKYIGGYSQLSAYGDKPIEQDGDECLACEG